LDKFLSDKETTKEAVNKTGSGLVDWEDESSQEEEFDISEEKEFEQIRQR